MKKNLFNISSLISMLLILAFVIYAFFFPQSRNETQIINITRGEHLRIVADKLYDTGIIKNKIAFKFLMYLTWNQNMIKSGDYQISPNSTLNNIKNKITSGRMYNKYITIPEGLTVKQIFEIINEKTDIIGDITVDVVEGELLPQTYAYNRDVTKNDLIIKMKEAMKKTIDSEWEKRNPNLPLKSKDEAIILASIVEKETSLPEERQLVAAVFINRLNKNMRLQSDPTIVYTLTNKYGNMMGRKLYKKNLQADTPYNTYKIKGLPIAPIANPGLDSIRATLNPATTEYLYFVADGSGGHKFSKTLDEHNENHKNWRRIRDSQ